MNMSTAFLIAGLGFGSAGVWLGTLPFVVGLYYIVAFVASTLLAGSGYWWYAAFALADLALATWFYSQGFGFAVQVATVLLIFMACVTAYAGRERGFLYEYYPAIGGVVNTLFIFLIGYYAWTHH